MFLLGEISKAFCGLHRGKPGEMGGVSGENYIQPQIFTSRLLRLEGQKGLREVVKGRNNAHAKPMRLDREPGSGTFQPGTACWFQPCESTLTSILWREEAILQHKHKQGGQSTALFFSRLS